MTNGYSDMGPRIGIFFTLVGGFLLLLFSGSITSGTGVAQWFLVGALSFFLGIFLLYRYRENPTSQRFRTIRKIMSRGRDEE